MDHSLFSTPAPSGSSTVMPRQNKVILQRQYRTKEGECFTILRDVIKELTGEELQTRHEILRKAIDLLLAASELRKSKEARPVHPTPVVAAGSGTTSHYTGSCSEPSHWPQDQSWQSAVDFDAQSAYNVFQSHDQQYYQCAPNMDSIPEQSSSPGYNQSWYTGMR